MRTADELYAIEQAQVEVDHHTPTAGAMIGHILSNLLLQQLKLNQARLTLSGNAQLFANQALSSMYHETQDQFDELNQLMLDEGEAIPTTTTEFLAYTFLHEDGALKYADAETVLFDLAKAIDDQLMFVTRGIALADKENKFALAVFLRQLEGWLKHQRQQIQLFLGHDVREGLDDEDEDD
ncbi:hypothetical protein [Lacticaseibacillus brantae]|uniref:Dna-binding ferritin-like protein (Oxidative damage protectant) n=1 Tax=Lacticaseibacillus brantae DSM 23927 TaxID=1423727 RepID=A0A0R2B051_9LACO|nr:hypothetical protein [Lacticaseibacillus brantae]KRM72909.1 dna-binding ferritin-like protein (oxidative damage protectant) [Lacticaseibacillus brantae DSM 23927]